MTLSSTRGATSSQSRQYFTLTHRWQEISRARRLEDDARERIAQATQASARQRRMNKRREAQPDNGIALPPALRLRLDAMRPAAGGAAAAIRAEWLSKHTGGTSQRAVIRPKPEPAPINAKLIKAADCQPPDTIARPDMIAEDLPMPRALQGLPHPAGAGEARPNAWGTSAAGEGSRGPAHAPRALGGRYVGKTGEGTRS